MRHDLSFNYTLNKTYTISVTFFKNYTVKSSF